MKVDFEYGFCEQGLGQYVRNPKTNDLLIFILDLDRKELRRKLNRKEKLLVEKTVQQQNEVLARTQIVVDMNEHITI